MDRLVLEGGKRVRKVRPSYRSWTKAKEKAFHEALAESCNVKLAAKRAGVSTSMAYVRRGKDASFRAGWDRALATGYAQLEMMMLERALHGVEKRAIARDGTKTVMREYRDRVGLALLRMHRDNAAVAAAGADTADYEEAVERIVERLERLREQGMCSAPNPSPRLPSPSRPLPQGEREIETKSAMDRIALIRRALAAA